MRVTIDIPADLAARLEPEREHLAEILQRGLQQRWSEAEGLRREVIAFLARGPKPEEILNFRPSPHALERVSQLMERCKAGVLAKGEQAEMDEIAQLDILVTLIKAEAQHLVTRATAA